MNYGLRWEFDSPTHNTNGVDVSPGSLYGPSLVQFQPGVLGGNLNPAFNVTGSMYHRDFVNPAPNIGVSWAPHAESGILGKVFGHDKSVFSAAYRIAYYDEGMNSISNIQSANPGASQSGSGAAAIAAAPGAYTVGGAPPPLVTSPSCFCFPSAAIELCSEWRHQLELCQPQSEDPLRAGLEHSLPARTGPGHHSEPQLHRQ